MVGFLYQMVLRKLNKKQNTGYGLCTAIEKACGHRPSYGSIYPLLEKMTDYGLLKVEKNGRKKVYSLTRKGKKEAGRTEDEMEQMVDEFAVNVKKFFTLMGQNPEPMLGILERMKHGDAPLGPITAQMAGLRDTVFRMAQTRRVERNARQINMILKDAIERLEALE